MDTGMIDILVKITGIAVAVVTTYKLFTSAIVLNRKSELRKQHLFLKRFINELSSQPPHPYVIEKGFAAVAGGRLSAEEIMFLLAQPNPSSGIRRYQFARHYVKLNAQTGILMLKENIKSVLFRRIRKLVGLSGYWLFASIALLPLLFGTLVPSGMTAAALSVWLFGFGGVAIFCLVDREKIDCAEELVEEIRKRKFSDSLSNTSAASPSRC